MQKLAELILHQEAGKYVMTSSVARLTDKQRMESSQAREEKAFLPRASDVELRPEG